ncbi:MAG: tRNA (guanosine(37)-N1)-methyltransferase TrmD [Anaerovoracaceae bacterium]|jgi:tRNA (guanine37-N1)-methyltransferase
MKITVLTLFPEMFGPVISHSILGRANKKGIIRVETVNIRDYTLDKHNRTDDTPFGGGAGMVMSAEPIYRALEDICKGNNEECDGENKTKRLIYLSPRGRRLNQSLIEELSGEKELVLLCGHYEGVDQRVLDGWGFEEVSIGDYILTGGELPAMVLIDGVARMLPSVLGSDEAHREESIYSGLLEYPQYTKPREYGGMMVPEVLISGDHERIRLWRFEKSLQLTKERRPDLFKTFAERIKNHSDGGGLTKKEIKIMEKVLEE